MVAENHSDDDEEDEECSEDVRDGEGGPVLDEVVPRRHLCYCASLFPSEEIYSETELDKVTNLANQIQEFFFLKYVFFYKIMLFYSILPIQNVSAFIFGEILFIGCIFITVFKCL